MRIVADHRNASLNENSSDAKSINLIMTRKKEEAGSQPGSSTTEEALIEDKKD